MSPSKFFIFFVYVCENILYGVQIGKAEPAWAVNIFERFFFHVTLDTYYIIKTRSDSFDSYI
jgi:hypothetical protein